MTAADRRRVAGTTIIGDATTVGGMRGTTEAVEAEAVAVAEEEEAAAGMTIGGGMTAAARRRVGVTRIGEAAMIGIVEEEEEGMGRPVGTEVEAVVGSRRGTARPSGARGLRSGMRQRRLVVEVAVAVAAVEEEGVRALRSAVRVLRRGMLRGRSRSRPSRRRSRPVRPVTALPARGGRRREHARDGKHRAPGGAR